MRQVLLHALHLLRRPVVFIVVLLLAGGGTAATWLPGLSSPGFELSLLLTIGVGILGGAVGIASGRQEARLLDGKGDRPGGVHRLDGALGSTVRATLSSFTLLTAALVPPLLTALVRALVTTDCNPFEFLGFFPMLTLPSALLASAVGVFLGFALPRVWMAALAWVVVLKLSAVVTAWPLIAGPQIFAFNHLLGYLPGPLYDEVLRIGPPLWWFRLQTVLLAIAVVTLTSGLLDVVSGRLGRPRVRPGTWAVFALASLGAFTIEQRAPTLGLRTNDRALEAALGATRESPHFRLIHPRGMAPEEVDRLLRDAEFRHHQLSGLLGEEDRKITLWLYRSDEEKARLVGAGQTQFAKPWRREIHLSYRSFPHPVLKHELAHVMAAPYGAGPFDVTARLFGLWPLMGIIEGTAVAADAPLTGELTLHEWAAGMRREKLAPDLRKILGPEGFYAQAPARAYTLAGSFLLHLADIHGPERLRSLYRNGDFQKSYGRSLDALIGEWEAYLDGLPLEAAAVSRAFARFREGALFARACGREVANLEQEAAGLTRSDPEEALRLIRRAGALQPEAPSFPLAEARLLRGLDRPKDADEVLKALAGRVKGQSALAGQVALERADLLLAMGHPDDAMVQLEAVLEDAPSPALLRTALVKQASLADPELRPFIASYFGDTREELRLWHLERGLERNPSSAVLHYLLGRRLTQVGAPKEALPHLSRALSIGLPEPLRNEAWRVVLEAHYLAGDCAGVRAESGGLPDLGPVFRSALDEWIARCDFEEKAYDGPLVPRSAFR